MHHLVNTLVLIEEVNGAQHRTVAELFAQNAYIQHDVVLGKLTQRVAGEITGNRLHLARNSGVFVRQIRMIALGVNYAQRMTELFKIRRNALDDGTFGVLEVDGDESANGGSHLIHQTRRVCRNTRSRRTGRSALPLPG